MDYMTCEQYVIGELEAAQALNDKLAAENDRLTAQLEILEGQEPSFMERRVADIGRKLVFEAWFFQCEAVDGQEFEDWRHKSAKTYQRPKDVSEAKAVKFFEPELRALYDQTKAEEEAEKEDKEAAK
ncbi:hypothetical protein [Olsenella sp. HMSC062G07]|uniref:hypothetical protein n=1 Tax=Olsenella sp. HMSC062G07 TaxID=1739330 RepID=UPI0008A21780|nr:hypothetical protein [Olsenella sp. HMSC062G07]OFK25058.1 hypothetical protein HMPREF2826_00280 [Olsenella sp. HMSC062G07]